MHDTPPAQPLAATTTLLVERVTAEAELRWRDLTAGLRPERVRADWRAGVCGKQVLFPQVEVGFAFEPLSTHSLKACLQALVAWVEGTPHAWREGHGGVHTHLLHLERDPAERFEFFVFDDQALYLAYHSNRGGMLACDLLVPIRRLVEIEQTATDMLTAQLDERLDGPEDHEGRSRYLGCWERLRARAIELDGRLSSLFPGFEEPLF